MAVASNTNNTEPTKPKLKYGKIFLTLENQILPNEKLNTTPSQSDGLDSESEDALRFYGSNLIQKYGIMLKLPQVAMATGQILYQRFYYAKSFVRHQMDIYAMGAIVAASKVEECPRRIRDIINVHHHEKQLRHKKPITSMPLDSVYTALKGNVIKAERRLLKELGFCVQVQHPHKFIITLLKVMNMEMNKELSQYAWNLMNDSLRTNVFLLYPPEQIAAACLHLSSQIQNIPLPTKPDGWYTILDLSEEKMNHISKIILGAYTKIKPDIEEAEKKVEELRIKQDLIRNKAKLLSGGFAPINHISNFSPSSKPSSPKNTDSKKDSSSKESSQGYKRSRSRTRSPSASPRKRRRHSVSSRSRSSSHSPKYRGKTPPRSYKEHHRSHHRESREGYRHHKARKSRSYSRSPSPINHHSNYHSSGKRSRGYKEKNYSASKSHHHTNNHENRYTSSYDYKSSHKSSKKDRSKENSRHSRSSPHRDRRR